MHLVKYLDGERINFLTACMRSKVYELYTAPKLLRDEILNVILKYTMLVEEDCSIYQCSYSSVEELFIDDRAHSAFTGDEKL